MRIEKLLTRELLTPISDQEKISHFSINTISIRHVMRIQKNVNQGIIGWSKNKFSELSTYELQSRQ